MAEPLDLGRQFPNPLRDGIVGDAWDAQAASDVATIHKDVFAACLRAVNHVHTFRNTGGLIIYGTAGSGKTHLIRRLREHLTAAFSTPDLSQLEQIFAYVRLDTSPQAIARHVRNRVASDLLRKSPANGVSQFELMVVARLMASQDGDGDMLLWWEYFRGKSSEEFENALGKLGDECGFSSNFTRVLTHLVLRQHRLDVAAWLRGESLSEQSYQRLGIGPPIDDDPESEALNVLRDFVGLASSNLPLIICFDQVEALQTNANDTQSLFAYGQLIRNLCNANQSLLLISCMQSALFADLQTALPDFQLAAVQAFTPQSLNPLTIVEAELLLKARLRGMAKVVDWPQGRDGLWPLTSDDVRSWVGQHGTTPRRLLFDAAEKFEQCLRDKPLNPQVPPPQLNEWLSQEWEQRFDQSQRERNREETIEILRSGLPDLIYLCDPSWKVTNERIPGLEFVIEGPQQEARVGIALLDNSAFRLPYQLRTINQRFPQQSNLQKLVLLRDERLPIGRNANVTREQLDRLAKNDAVMRWVAPAVCAALDAARSLLAAAKAGDLSFQGNTISHESVIQWLRANLPNDLKETIDVLLLPATGRDFTSTIVERLQEHVMTVSVCSLDQAAEQLSVSAEAVRSAANERPDLFGIVPGTPSAIFSTRFSSRCLQSSPAH